MNINSTRLAFHSNKDEIWLCGLIEYMCNIVLRCGHMYVHTCRFTLSIWQTFLGSHLCMCLELEYSDVCIACRVHAMPREFNIFIPYTYRSTVKTVLHGPLHTCKSHACIYNIVCMYMCMYVALHACTCVIDGIINCTALHRTLSDTYVNGSHTQYSLVFNYNTYIATYVDYIITATQYTVPVVTWLLCRCVHYVIATESGDGHRRRNNCAAQCVATMVTSWQYMVLLSVALWLVLADLANGNWSHLCLLQCTFKCEMEM